MTSLLEGVRTDRNQRLSARDGAANDAQPAEFFCSLLGRFSSPPQSASARLSLLIVNLRLMDG
jgi:hypothetical protein